MADTRIARAFLQDLLTRLAAGELDPGQADWPFAAECWRAIREELERLNRELDVAEEAVRAWELVGELEMKLWNLGREG